MKILSMFPVVLEFIIQYYHLSYPAVQQNTEPISHLSISQDIMAISLSLLPKENELMFRTMFLVKGNQDIDIVNI